ncbi:acyltransferase family protein [Mycolicibacterium anyangense]|uniref:acyltransferase family protein n=1 Tax=Mycolicibacterium anyangense TaxID=1431246 RepID=UPI003898FEA9
MSVGQANSVDSAHGVQERRAASTGFRPDIEGLRAVAVLGVVFFHASIPGIGGGYVGVDVFFVISGFLITGLLWREASSTGTVALRTFYGARARRLLPASAFVGVITMIAALVLLPPLRVPTVLYDGIASALYVGNYWFIIDNVNYFSDLLTPSPFLHYWSLSVEEQFYLIWAPLVLGTAWAIRRFRRDKTTPVRASRRPYLVVLGLVGAASFALSLVITYVVPAAAFFSLPTRAWQLAAGGLLALTVPQWQRLSARAAAVVGWAGLAMVVVACLWYTPTTPFPGTAALLPTAGAALIIGAGCAAPAQGCGRLLGTAPMRSIGRISYSWYLWHWPVLVLAPALVGHPLGLGARILAAVLSAGLAWLTLHYLENPLRFGQRIRQSAWRSLALGAAATAVAVCTGLGLLKAAPTAVGPGAPAAPLALNLTPPPPNAPPAAYDTVVGQALSQIQAALTLATAPRPVPANLVPPLDNLAAEQGDYTYGGCVLTPYQDGQPSCAMGDTASPTRVALVGDSHAAMWTPALREIATQRGWRLELMAKEACPILDIHVEGHFRRLIERLQHCEHWRAGVMDRLKAERPQLVVLSVWRGYGIDETMTGFRGFDPAWIDSLTRLVKELRANGSQVLVLGPIPAPHANVPICISGHLDNAAACALSRTTSVDQAGITAEANAAKANGGQYADLTDYFCTAQTCPVIVGNALVYLDVSHLTLQYSRVLAPVMAALTDRAMAGG